MGAKNGKIAVIGAGASACFFSHLLRDTGYEITIFEKSRGIGGRCSVRRTEEFGAFNLGAQFFTNKNKTLAPYFEEIDKKGLIKELTGPVGYLNHEGNSEPANQQKRFIGTPSMNSFLKYWSSSANLALCTKVTSIAYSSNQWTLTSDLGSSYGGFDACVLTVPQPQGLELWNQHSQIKVPATEMFPCIALMIASSPVPLSCPHGFIKHPMLSWFSSKQSKEHDQLRTWMVHANPEWSSTHFDADENWIIEQMTEQLFSLLKVSPKILFSKIHRWRYASSKSISQGDFLWDPHKNLGYIGDWLRGGRVEGAMESAASLASLLTKTDL